MAKVKRAPYTGREEKFANPLRSMPPLRHTPDGYDAETYDISAQSEVVKWLHANLSPQQVDQLLFDACINLKGATPEDSRRLGMIERVNIGGVTYYQGVPRDGVKTAMRANASQLKLNAACEVCAHCVSSGTCDCGVYGRENCPDFN